MMKRVDTWLRCSGMQSTMEDLAAVSAYFGTAYGRSCSVVFEGVWRIGCAICFVVLVHEDRVEEYICNMKTNFPELETEESRGFRPSV